jgi:hypothetical protein
MTPRPTLRAAVPVIVELLFAVLAAAGAGAAWTHVARRTRFFPDGDLPGFTATHYSGALLFAGAVLTVVAVALTADAARRVLDH